MDEQQPVATNGRVIAVAGGAAAVAAALVVGLGRSRNAAPATITLVVPDDLQVTVRETPEQAEAADRRSREAAAALAEIVAASRDEARAAAQAASRASAPLLERIADLGSAAPVDVGRVRERAREAMARGGEKRIEVTGRATERVQRVGGQTAVSAQSIAAHAATAAAATAERARGLGASLTEAAKDRAPQVRDKVGDEVVPPVRDAALHAASTASDLWQKGRDRAAAVLSVPEPEPTKRGWQKALARAAFWREAPLPPKGRWQSARDRAAAVAHVDLEAPSARAAQALETGSGRAREATAAVAKRASEIGGKAKDAPRKTAEATVDTGKDASALLLWGSAAAGLVFYALMTPDVREQVFRTLGTASAQIQELVRDFRGYDDEF